MRSSGQPVRSRAARQRRAFTRSARSRAVTDELVRPPRLADKIAVRCVEEGYLTASRTVTPDARRARGASHSATRSGCFCRLANQPIALRIKTAAPRAWRPRSAKTLEVPLAPTQGEQESEGGAPDPKSSSDAQRSSVAPSSGWRSTSAPATLAAGRPPAPTSSTPESAARSTPCRRRAEAPTQVAAPPSPSALVHRPRRAPRRGAPGRRGEAANGRRAPFAIRRIAGTSCRVVEVALQVALLVLARADHRRAS